MLKRRKKTNYYISAFRAPSIVACVCALCSWRCYLVIRHSPPRPLLLPTTALPSTTGSSSSSSSSSSSPLSYHHHPNAIASTHEERQRARFLESSSMWALGANARTIPPRRQNVPLVTWSPGAVVAVAEAWTNVQHAAPCSRAMFVRPSFWGITSQMRDYGDAALISLAFHRPLRHMLSTKSGQRRAPKWCAKDAWLGCFFNGFDSKRCHIEASDAQPFRPNTSTPALRFETFNKLKSPQSLAVVEYMSDFSFVLDDARFFPSKLWEELLEARLIRIVDTQTFAILDPAILKQKRPGVYQTVAVSALRTILVPAVFAPRKHIRRSAARKIAAMRLQEGYAQPCVSLHLRWTDKHADGGVAGRMRPDVGFIVAALDRITQIMQRSYPCLLLLSDDDKHALPLLTEALKVRGMQVLVLTHIADFFSGAGYGRRDEVYNMYARLGHSYVPDYLLKDAPDAAFAYFREVVVDILVAASSSDVLVGVGSSGVSQLLAQYMGHAHRADANAMALWQEDLLELT